MLPARITAYLKPRSSRGTVPARLVLRAWIRSVTISPRNRVNARRYPDGLKKSRAIVWLSPTPLEPSAMEAVVRYERVASPVTRLQMLTPLFDSRPSPLEARLTISAASDGLLDCISFWRSRSNQRKAGMPSFVP